MKKSRRWFSRSKLGFPFAALIFLGGCSPQSSFDSGLPPPEEGGANSKKTVALGLNGGSGDSDESGGNSGDTNENSGSPSNLLIDFPQVIVDFTAFSVQQSPSPGEPQVTEVALDLKLTSNTASQNGEVRLITCDANVPVRDRNPVWDDRIHCQTLNFPIGSKLNDPILRTRAIGLNINPEMFYYSRISFAAQNAAAAQFNAEFRYIRISTKLGQSGPIREVYFDPCIKKPLVLKRAAAHDSGSAFVMSKRDVAVCLYLHTVTAQDEESFDRNLGQTHDLINFSMDPANNTLYHWLGRGSRDPVQMVFPDTNYAGGGALAFELGNGWNPDQNYRLWGQSFDWIHLTDAGEFNRFHLKQTGNDQGVMNHLYFDTLTAYRYQPGSDLFTQDPLHRRCRQTSRRMVYLYDVGRFPNNITGEVVMTDSSLLSAELQAYCNTLGVN